MTRKHHTYDSQTPYLEYACIIVLAGNKQTIKQE